MMTAEPFAERSRDEVLVLFARPHAPMAGGIARNAGRGVHGPALVEVERLVETAERRLDDPFHVAGDREAPGGRVGDGAPAPGRSYVSPEPVETFTMHADAVSAP